VNLTEPLLLVALLILARQAWSGSRRRSALNRALHEIRRPLQALALSVPEQAAVGGVQAGPVWQAISAVGELDRELNGADGDRPCHEQIAARLMADACVRRTQARADLAGSRVRLRWAGPDALVHGDGPALAGAIENLLLNAIEHGGPEITLNAVVTTDRLRLEVIDSGRGKKGEGMVRRVSRHGRHGHGLAIAEHVAENHGGRLEKKIAESGSNVALILPLDPSIRSRRSAISAGP